MPKVNLFPPQTHVLTCRDSIKPPQASISSRLDKVADVSESKSLAQTRDWTDMVNEGLMLLMPLPDLPSLSLPRITIPGHHLVLA